MSLMRFFDLVSHIALVDLVLFSYFAMAILRTMSEHVVASSRVETDDAPLSLDFVT